MATQASKLGMDRKKFDRALETVANWDFSLTIEKLQEPQYAGWSESRARAAEKNYKRYLAVTKGLNGYQLVPNGDIDRFWHEHILDTRRYAKDCDLLFGEFLHHYPYYGMRGDVDRANWIDTARASDALWHELFDDDLYSSFLAGVGAPMKCPQGCPNPSVEAEGAGAPMKCPQGCPNPGVEAEGVGAPMKCPQGCPNPGVEAEGAGAPMKCPQGCPNPSVEAEGAGAPMKCPQGCPNPGVEAEAAGAPMKCPQGCPNPGI